MFSSRFDHYLTYGATDQQTVRDLAGRFSGLLVPGTVAAFQREGTGGFVLTLSATDAKTPYSIDPRFPLFQNPLPAPKKSHESLAKLLGLPGLISEAQPTPAWFTAKRIDTIAKNWARFNSSYRDSATSKFDKYAKRLNEEVAPESARGPQYVLPPYTMVSSVSDRWWDVSKRLFERTSHHVGDSDRCVQVLAAKDTGALAELLPVGPARAAIWVSRLSELDFTSIRVGRVR